MAAEKKVRERKGPPVPPEMAGLPERLRRAMRKRGLDQPKLAKKSGVSQPAISNLARGTSLDGVTAVNIARLALALDVPSGWLLTADGDVIPRLVSRAKARGEPIVLEEGRDSLVPESVPAAEPDEGRKQSP